MSTPPPPPDQPTQPGGWGPPPPDRPTQPIQPGGWEPPVGPPAAPPPARRPRLWRGRQVLLLTLAAGGAGLILGIVIGAAVAGFDEAVGTRPRAAATTTLPPTTATVEEPASTAASYPEPKLSDFTLKLVELKRQKFGSAGANVTFKIQAGWGPTYDPNKTYQLIYEIRGGEDGPERNYMEITGDEYRTEDEQTISTTHVDEKLTVKAITIEEI
jgi:hypothetical protein